MWGRKTGPDLRLPSHDTLWTCVGSLGEALEMSIVVSPRGREMDPVAQKPRVYGGKKIAKSSRAWCNPRITAEISKMVAMLGIVAWMEGATFV